MNSRSPSNLLHSLPTPSQFSEPKTQTDFFRIFCSAVVLRSCNVIMAGEAVDHVEPWHVLWLRFCFVRVWRQPLKGTVFDSSITAIVAVSAQQSCCMQVRVMPPAAAAAPALQLFVLKGSVVVCRVFRNAQQVRECQLSPTLGFGLVVSDQSTCTVVNSRWRGMRVLQCG